MPRGVRHNTAARGHERPKSSRDGVAATKKEGWSACQEGWLGPASPRGERGPTSPRAAASAHRAPLPHSQPPEGPDLRSQGDLDAGRGRRTLSAPHPPRGPKPAPSRRPAGRRRPAVPRRTPRGPGQGSARPGIRPPRNNGRRGCGGHDGRGGAGAPGRWKLRPSAGSLTTRAGPRRLLPAPRRSTPGGAPAGALQQQPLLCRAGPGVGAGASSFPPSPVAMSQGSPGDWAPLDPTPGSPAPPNPFVHELHLSRLQRVKFCLLGALLAPIRVLLAFIVLFLLWPFAWLQVAGLTEEQLQEPITGWRKTVCHNGVLGLSRLLFFLLGFLRIRVRGQRASRLQAPVLVAAPHSTFFDPIVLLPCDLPKVVSRAENLSVPVIGALLRFNQAILVSRHDPASRRRVVEEVRRRATSGGKWPQVLFFPEGTCSNKKALLKFKPGAFIAGVPVQPVLIQYPNSLDTTSWAWRGPGVDW
ncbi:lysophospholipid acyltransferase LPCAT4 isoform X2 [Mustela erminea]|uniref:lysophospholipid acyltransferase LPCAT4 isoform X2 n=1 Tax=Mustela erminea TaxID=36723 RepID=UPI0013870874|nr:lysophospholipid acyltransferase LPCAT4 isoform X2 [Mustela erminea]